MREHLESLQRQGGQVVEQLFIAPCPIELEYLWVWFCKLRQHRTSNGFGMNRLEPVQIEAWFRLERADVEPWEVDVIYSLDTIDMRFLQKIAKPVDKE